MPQVVIGVSKNLPKTAPPINVAAFLLNEPVA